MYRHLEWLNSYAEFNELASRKILKKFIKNFFINKDNKIKGEIESYLETKQIGKREELKGLLEELYKFFVI